MKNTSKFDAAIYLKTDESRSEYMNGAIDTGDAEFIERARETVARATLLYLFSVK